MSDVELMLGDCLDRMAEIPDGSVDLVCTDPPYGKTACRWDSVIPLEPLWEQYRRVLKPSGCAVFTACQPFSSMLVASCLPWFKYSLVWDKRASSGGLNADVMPLVVHEDVLVFARGRTTYNKQMRPGKAKRYPPRPTPNGDIRRDKSVVVRSYENPDGLYNPVSILEFSNANQHETKYHPTQKPILLFEYLIRTFSNPGEVVLDNAMGGGTTIVAALNTGRRAIGIEKDLVIFAVAESRVSTLVASMEATKRWA